MTDSRFQLDESRSYWRHVPSGSGKHDTATMLSLPDAELAAIWDEGFRARFSGYPEEDIFLRTFAPSVADRHMLSIGSGLGLHELYYQAAGAQVTCADIVDSNLRVIHRVSAIKGLQPATALLDGTGTVPDGPFDVLYIYGALMHMPLEQQRALLQSGVRQLTPDGRIVLMLYTWTFAAATCGWRTPDAFDPVVFGRASDPAVGGESCPWADWHDDAKVSALAGAGYSITKRQEWNGGFYIWYELTRTPTVVPQPFFDLAANQGALAGTVDPSSFTAADATPLAPRRFETSRNHFHYAAVSGEHSGAATAGANALQVRLTVETGRVSVGLLDVGAQAFVASAVAGQQGTQELRLTFERMPERAQVIVSNHCVNEPSVSRFAVDTIEYRRIERAEPPMGPRR